jgi:hypothetical protein
MSDKRWPRNGWRRIFYRWERDDEQKDRQTGDQANQKDHG